MFWATSRCFRAAFLFCASLWQVAAFGQAAPTFDILEFEVDGNSVLAVPDIERAVTPFLGAHKQLADVEAARAALEKAYQGAGYMTVFVDVPEQRVDGGVVRLAVTEGRIERLKVSGSRYYSQGYIRDKVPELADGRVPNFNEMQRQLAIVNRNEERRVQPIMRAGRTPGTVETELKVDDRLPLGGSIELNNRHAVNTEPLRLVATARYENLFQLDHSIALTLQTAPQATRQSTVFSLNYTIPNDDQSAWVAYVVDSDSNVAALGDINVLGKGTTLGLRYVRPVFAGTDQSHSVTLGVDYKDLKEETRNGSDTAISTPLRYLPFVAAYAGNIEHGTQNQTQINAQWVAAFRPLLRRDVDCPAGVADQFACKRKGGDGGFSAVRADLRHSLPFGASGTAHLRLGAQLATGPIPSGEQFAIGGADSVRGYLEAEAAGDHALLGTLEWRSANFGPRLIGTGEGGASPLQVQALAFVDVARAYVSDPATGQAPHVSLAGTGLGLRVKVRKSMSGELDLAWPLKATSATEKSSPRLHVKLSVEL
jgi:hemolysin activation/secretion protein